MKKTEKSLKMRKKLKGGHFDIFQHPFCRKTPEQMKGDPLGNQFLPTKMSGNAEKN